MSIELDDLIEKCVTCGGSGQKPPPPVQQAGGRSFGRQEIEVQSTNTCEPCMGTGRVKLTESGEALLKFIGIMKKRQRL